MSKTDDEARAVAAHLAAIYTGDPLRVGEIAVHPDCPVGVPPGWVGRPGSEAHCAVLARRLLRGKGLGLVSISRRGRAGPWLYAPVETPELRRQQAGDRMAALLAEQLIIGTASERWLAEAQAAVDAWEDNRQ